MNIDCFDGLPELPDQSIDAIITDLPYGQTARNKWDLVLPMNEHLIVKDKPLYLDDYLLTSYKHGISYNEAISYFSDNRNFGLWNHFNRIIKPNGVIILFGNGIFTANLMKGNEKYWKYNIIWEKTQPTGFLNAKKMPLRSHEDMCIFYKKPPTYNPQMSSGHIRKVSKAIHKVGSKETLNYREHCLSDYDSTERYPRSVWKFAKDSQKCPLHPTQKPVLLLEELIKTYTNLGNLVLDICGGSMSMAVAAINTGRRYICYEKDKDIYDDGIRRIESLKFN